MSKFGDFSLLLRMAHYTSYCLFGHLYVWISVGNLELIHLCYLAGVGQFLLLCVRSHRTNVHLKQIYQLIKFYFVTYHLNFWPIT